MNKPIKIEGTWELPFTRAEVWPLLSRTDWLTQSLGLPSAARCARPLPNGGVAVFGQGRFAGLRLQWEEVPLDWLEEEFFRGQWLFTKGPFAEAEFGLELRDKSPGEIWVRATATVKPRVAWGGWLAEVVLAPKLTKGFKRVIQQVTEALQARKPVAWPRLRRASVDETALQAALQPLLERGFAADLAARLGSSIREAADVELTAIRPLALARQWNQEPWEVVRLCLHGARCGLLELSWRILCPACRLPRTEPVRTLAQLPGSLTCELCQVSHDGEFDRSVELTFTVATAIRERPASALELPHPANQPHIGSQVLLAPGQRRAWRIPPLTQRMRLRSPQVKEPVTLSPDEAPTQVLQPVILCEPDAFKVRMEYGRLPDYAVQVLNPNDYPVLLILERLEWSADILSAAQVTAWQEFRDLFPAETVAAKKHFTVGAQAVLVTSLYGHGAPGHRLDDAAIFRTVQMLAAVFKEILRQRHGGLVRVDGDTFLAVFGRPEDALAAARLAHERLPEADPHPGLQARLALRSALHVGPCLVVNANDRLDYTGATIRLAAALVETCPVNELVMTDAFLRRIEAAAAGSALTPAPVAAEAKVRGFDQIQKVWRLAMK
ncbi:MAG: adenylate/guanylate cyclase domain-containing protein [Verrucomicrobia bacterium]|nr:adenylate/guanylate cyclase domain-containing protein [Verrucomicrobiota bacterium]